MRRRFFVEEFKDGGARLEGDAARHLGRVLRAEEGQLYELSDGREVFLAAGRIARRIGLDQIRKIFLEIAQHSRRGVIGIGNETEIDNFLRFFVSDELGKRGRMRGFVEKMPSKLSRRKSCGRLVHVLFVAL